MSFRTRGPFFNGVAFGLAIFLVAVVIGFLTYSGSSNPDSFTTDIAGKTTFFGVLTNNAFVLVAILVGGVTFGLPAVFLLFTTGSVLGNAIALAVDLGFGPTQIMMLVLPHGIIEIPALVVAAGVSMESSWRIVRYLDGSLDRPYTDDELWNRLGVVVLCFVGIVVAAAIEAFVVFEYAESLTA